MSGVPSRLEVVQLTIRIPRDLHAVLKGHCVNLGLSVNAYVTRVLMEQLPAAITITREV